MLCIIFKEFRPITNKYEFDIDIIYYPISDTVRIPAYYDARVETSVLVPRQCEVITSVVIRIMILRDEG